MGITRDIPNPEPEAAGEFELLYEKLRLPVYRIIRGVVLDGPAAEDLTQKTFERAYRRWQRRPASESPAWVYEIAADVTLGHIRRQRWARRPLSRLLQPGSATAAVESASAAERALAALSPEQRLLVVLTFYAQLSEPEVSAILRASPKALAAELERVLGAMRDTLEITDHGAARERLKG